MSFRRYPDIATLYTAAAGTLNTFGVYSPGAVTAVTIQCRIEPNGGRFIVRNDGSRIEYSNTVFAPLTTMCIPEGMRMQLSGKNCKVLQVPPRQKYTEIKC